MFKNKPSIFNGTPIGKINFPRWPIFDKREEKALLKVLNSGKWSYLGPEEKAFEENFAEFIDCKYAITAPNGTQTLRLALEALDIGPGDEVIVPGFTWQATAASVLDVNAIPILVDIDPNTYCIDPGLIEKSITEKTKCIIPVHLFCRVSDMDKIRNIADKKKLYIIEDCAHQHGSEWQGKKVGSIGDIGSFSLQQSKLLTSGEGGVLTTNNKFLAERLHSLKNCGKPLHSEAVSIQSGNYRLTEFQSAILNCQLERLNEQNEHRSVIAECIEDEINKIDGLSILRKDLNVTSQSYYALIFRFEKSKWLGMERDDFIMSLNSELEGTIPFLSPIYAPLNESPYYQPHSKKTHNISQPYWKKIDPSSSALPNACLESSEKAIGIHHSMLLSSKVEIHKFIDALNKISHYRESLGRHFSLLNNMGVAV